MSEVVDELQSQNVDGQTRNALIGFIDRNMPDYEHSGIRGNKKSQKSRFKIKAKKKTPIKKRRCSPEKFIKSKNAILKNIKVHFAESANGQCRWPLWDDHAGYDDKFVCGVQAEDGGSYCKKHNSKSVGTGTPAEKSAHRANFS